MSHQHHQARLAIETLFDTFPQLSSSRLLLRQLRATDADALLHIFADEQVTQFLDIAPFTHVDEATRYINARANDFKLKRGIRWGITSPPDDRVIGLCGFPAISHTHLRAEIGYELAQAYWRQGIMTEAVGTMLRFGFTTLGLHRVQARVDPHNTASIQLLKTLRFQQEGVMRETCLVQGRFLDEVLFSLLCTEFV
jgi:ribosomal-protein-alanine N-acetyltransferase